MKIVFGMGDYFSSVSNWAISSEINVNYEEGRRQRNWFMVLKAREAIISADDTMTGERRIQQALRIGSANYIPVGAPIHVSVGGKWADGRNPIGRIRSNLVVGRDKVVRTVPALSIRSNEESVEEGLPENEIPGMADPCGSNPNASSSSRLTEVVDRRNHVFAGAIYHSFLMVKPCIGAAYMMADSEVSYYPVGIRSQKPMPPI